MTTQHEPAAIERDFDAATMRGKGAAWLIGIAVAAIGLLWWGTTHAQTLTAPTRISPYDWACLAANGAVLSNHQRFDTAFVACYNNADGAEIVGGRYRIGRATPPDPVPPACPAKPADDTRAGVCPSGTTGSWTQTRTHASAAAPICWQAGEWLPATPPAGACTATPPAALTAPTLATPTHEAGTLADRYNVILSWSAVPGATSYRVDRCAGPNCSTMSVHAANVTGTTYKNTGIPANTYKYQIRARRGTSEVGPASNLQVYKVTAITAPPPPPPAGTGTASLSWTPPTENTDGSALTNLAGFRIHYSTVGDAGPSLSKTIDVGNAGAMTYVVSGLSAGPWAFAVEAYNAQGHTSLPSNTVTKIVP
jgi:hypothetical protein